MPVVKTCTTVPVVFEVPGPFAPLDPGDRLDLLPQFVGRRWAETVPVKLLHPGSTWALAQNLLDYGQTFLASPRTKKADVAEHPEVFRHVGLLTTKPPGTAGLLFI